MKKIIPILFCFINLSFYAQVGIGTTSPDNSSILDISSTDKGVLIPRMTALERISITTPLADGLMVYQTDDVKGFYFYDATSASWDRVLKQSKDAIPTGAIFTFPFASTPTGYLVCDGSAVSRTTYADLFAVLGVTYGNGNGSTTFNLPDYRGKFLRGTDDGSGNDPDAITRQDRGDGTTGDHVGTSQNDEMISHLHQIDPPSTASTVTGSHDHTTISVPNVYTTNSGNHRHTTTARSLSTNSTGAHNHSIRGDETNITSTGTGWGGTSEFLVDSSGSDTFHTNSISNHSHSFTIPALNTDYNGIHDHRINIPALDTNTSGNHDHDIDIAAFNSDVAGATENRPTNISVVYCIKY